MDKNYYIDLAKAGKRMAFGADLEVKSHAAYQEILHDGSQLGACIIEATRKYSAPLALPYMDLKIEKEYLLTLLGIPAVDIEKYRFEGGLTDELIENVSTNLGNRFTSRMRATCEGISYVKNNSGYLPVGMCIGPFSLMTKLLDDPITAVFMASMGISGEDDPQVRDVEIILEAGTLLIDYFIRRQTEAGAKAVVICEPAANTVYISPDTLSDQEEDVFDRYLVRFNRRLRDTMEHTQADLILHDCGELNHTIIRKLCSLQPRVLSLGSSRNLWEDAAVVPEDIVLFGNLPTRQFFMDDVISKDQVLEMTRNLCMKMKKTGHAFIIGSECDVLSIEGHEKTIVDKLNAMLYTRLD